MATTLILKKSTTGGAEPVSGDLEKGELAINLTDRKLYTKDNGNNIVLVGNPYVGGTAPSNPEEGDLWYDTTNNILKAYNGTSFDSLTSTTGTVTSVGITEGDLIDVSNSPITSSGSITVNVDLEELTDMTEANTEDDELVILDDSVTAGSRNRQKRKAISEIKLSTFNNDSGFLTSESDTLDSVTDRGSSTTNDITVGGDGDNVQLTVKGNASQTANIVEVLSSGGSALFTVDKDGDTVIAGDLTVSGSTTTVNSNEVNIGDSIILLNADIDVTTTPSEDGGISIKRGNEATKTFKWNETSGAWDLGSETLQNVTLDGGAY